MVNGNTKNPWNQGSDAANKNRNLGIAVGVTQNSYGSNKFKEWREIKIIKNEHICKNLVSHI